MSVLLHVSDPHFGTEQAEVLEALLHLVRVQQPDVAVFSGDITQRARRSQFRAARTFVDQLSVPVTLVLPGNHDIPLFNLVARIFFPYANYQREFGQALEPTFESANLLIIGVNTTRPYRHIDGEVSPEQIQQVAARLRRANPQQLCIVVTHQPLQVTRPEDEKNLLHGYKNAIVEWAKAGADLLLGGHIHLPYIRPLRGHFRDVFRRIWVVQAGTAMSTRVRYHAPNSINVIRYVHPETSRRCVVERWDYHASAHRFEKVEPIEELPLDEKSPLFLA